jgi:hypothetical protein
MNFGRQHAMYVGKTRTPATMLVNMRKMSSRHFIVERNGENAQGRFHR